MKRLACRPSLRVPTQTLAIPRNFYRRRYGTSTPSPEQSTAGQVALDEHRSLLEEIGKTLGIKRMTDWYSVAPQEIEKLVGGSSLLREYPSLPAMLRAIYPQNEWSDSKFVTSSRSQQSHWIDINNQRTLVEEVGKALKISQMSDWYSITRQEFSDKGGKILFNYYGTMEELLRGVYPEYTWQVHRFKETARVPRGHWNDRANRLKFLEDVAQRLNIKEPSGWYNVSRNDLDRFGGKGLWRYYVSVEDLLKSNYPEYPWDVSKFIGAGRKNVPMGFWRDRNNIMYALEKAEEAIGIKKPEDWYSVQLTELREVGFPHSVNRVQLAELLSQKYPAYKWDKVYLLRGRFAQQKRLERAITALFPKEDIIINARREAGLLNPLTNDFLELDVWLPSLNLGLEYQERHHYTDVNFTYTPLDEIQQRDALKCEVAKAKGVTLVVIPCWWDGKQESLAATIKQARPDLLMHIDAVSPAVASTMPEDFIKKNADLVEGIGVPVTACFMTQTNVNPTNWWLFEKYDGIRGFWNPEKKAIFSRRGNILPIPAEIINTMPTDTFLDGELWFGRENFQEAMKIANRSDPAGIAWKDFKYMVFDVPNHTAIYEERYSTLESRFKDAPHPYIEVAPKQVCKSTEHFEKLFQDILDKGGEGVILRDPGAEYVAGRSQGYLKHKKFRDAEAKVVGPAGYQKWECELPNGVRFTASPGTLQFAERWSPVEGDIVSFKHHGFLLGTGKPKLATIYRLRHDLIWDDVVKNWKEQKPAFTAWPVRRTKFRMRKKGHWTNPENRRKYFCDLATELGFDPLNPQNWSSVTAEKVRRKKGAGLLGHFGGSLLPALRSAFPELEFQAQDTRKPKGYWHDVENRKQFFTSFAAERGFDPLQPENWERASRGELLKKGGSRLLAMYKGSLQEALEATFPAMKFTKNLQEGQAKAQWKANYFARLFYYHQTGASTPGGAAEAAHLTER